jgi:hypothetical protein
MHGRTPLTEAQASPAAAASGWLEASVLGVSVWAPGLPGWEASRPVLAGEAPLGSMNVAPPAPAMLGSTERRRAGPVVRLALAVAGEAAARSGVAPGVLRSVFGSSNGDGLVVGSILDALARATEGERVVSPTQFHNSVHNAAAGYWSIAQGSRQAANCLGAHDWTWAASLLKAIVEVAAEREPVLLCCYDHPLPPPLDALRPTGAAFGVALVLSPVQAGTPLLAVRWQEATAVPAPLPPALDRLRGSNAVAACLPLLVALASGQGGEHALPYLDGHLAVRLAGADASTGSGPGSGPGSGSDGGS